MEYCEKCTFIKILPDLNLRLFCYFRIENCSSQVKLASKILWLQYVHSNIPQSMNHCNAHLAQGYFLHHYIHVAINDGEEEQDVFFVISNLSNLCFELVYLKKICEWSE